MKFLDSSGLSIVWDAIKDRYQPKLSWGGGLSISGNTVSIDYDSIPNKPNLGSYATQSWVGDNFLDKNIGGTISGTTRIGTERSAGILTGFTGFEFDTDTNQLKLYDSAGASPTVRISPAQTSSFIEIEGLVIHGNDTAFECNGAVFNLPHNKSGVHTLACTDDIESGGGGNYLPLSGGTLTGELSVNNATEGEYQGVIHILDEQHNGTHIGPLRLYVGADDADNILIDAADGETKIHMQGEALTPQKAIYVNNEPYVEPISTIELNSMLV